MTVQLTVRLFADRLPTVVTKLARRRPRDGAAPSDGVGSTTNRLAAQSKSPCPRAPVTAHGEVLLTPLRDRVAAAISARPSRSRVPLVGGLIENFIIGRLGDDIGAVQRFTNEWIAANR